MSDEEKPADEEPKDAAAEDDEDEGEEEEKEEKQAPEKAAVSSAPAKPVNKTVEWALAIAMMLILIAFVAAMMYLMRNAKNAVM